jgi:prepilin-type N-terminal cleavage/methylation domain-containing protein
VNKRKQTTGFTLIELLVVIAIIALLLSILLPALSRVKESGKRSLCLFNVKSLATAWTIYVQENDGRFPKAHTADDGWIRVVAGYPTNPEQAPVDLQMEALEKGLLYPYLETTEIFRCPVAKKDELRTYSMTHALNGIAITANYGGKILTRIYEIRNTGNRIVFLDDFIRDWDACWMVFNDLPNGGIQPQYATDREVMYFRLPIHIRSSGHGQINERLIWRNNAMKIALQRP